MFGNLEENQPCGLFTNQGLPKQIATMKPFDIVVELLSVIGLGGITSSFKHHLSSDVHVHKWFALHDTTCSYWHPAEQVLYYQHRLLIL